MEVRGAEFGEADNRQAQAVCFFYFRHPGRKVARKSFIRRRLSRRSRWIPSGQTRQSRLAIGRRMGFDRWLWSGIASHQKDQGGCGWPWSPWVWRASPPTSWRTRSRCTWLSSARLMMASRARPLTPSPTRTRRMNCGRLRTVRPIPRSHLQHRRTPIASRCIIVIIVTIGVWPRMPPSPPRRARHRVGHGWWSSSSRSPTGGTAGRKEISTPPLWTCISTGPNTRTGKPPEFQTRAAVPWKGLREQFGDVVVEAHGKVVSLIIPPCARERPQPPPTTLILATVVPPSS